MVEACYSFCCSQEAESRKEGARDKNIPFHVILSGLVQLLSNSMWITIEVINEWIQKAPEIQSPSKQMTLWDLDHYRDGGRDWHDVISCRGGAEDMDHCRRGESRKKPLLEPSTEPCHGHSYLSLTASRTGEKFLLYKFTPCVSFCHCYLVPKYSVHWIISWLSFLRM